MQGLEVKAISVQKIRRGNVNRTQITFENSTKMVIVDLTDGKVKELLTQIAMKHPDLFL